MLQKIWLQIDSGETSRHSDQTYISINGNGPSVSVEASRLLVKSPNLPTKKVVESVIRAELEERGIARVCCVDNPVQFCMIDGVRMGLRQATRSKEGYEARRHQADGRVI